MKRSIVVFISVLITSTGVFSQSQSSILLKNANTSATLAPNVVIYTTTTAGDNVKVTFDIKNTDSTTHTYNVKRYDLKLHSTSTATAIAYFCFAGNCYGSSTFVSPTSLTLNAGQSASQITASSYQMLIADLDEADMVGYSLVKYTFINTASAADSVQIGIQYNSGTGIFNTQAKAVFNAEVYPNPSKNTDVVFLKVNTETSTKAITKVVNAIGQVIYEKQISLNVGLNNLPLNVLNYPSGVYFIIIESDNRTVVKKLIVND